MANDDQETKALVQQYIKQHPRSVPANDLDLQMQVTDPAWQNLSPDLQEKLLKKIGEEIQDGESKTLYETLHGILGLYTRDIRLGNLSTWNGEYDFVSYFLESAVIYLEAKFPRACICALNLALAKLEPSSSKSGFLRKLINTIRSESYKSSLEPEKKSPLGGMKKNV